HDNVAEILRILVKNAIEAMPLGGRLYLSAENEDHFVSIEVHDTGPGISSEDQQRIFRPFVSGKGSLGLGLPLAFSFATRNGGTLDVRSTLGEGSVFRIRLPKA